MATNGEDAYGLLQSYKYDLVVLDWNLPGLSGIEVLRRLRSAQDNTPVMMLTGERHFRH